MPCWELFEAETPEYRDEVLPPSVKARLSVEAGIALGWKQWVGDEGDSISIEHYGASAAGDLVLREFGYSAENIVTRALALAPACPDGTWPLSAAVTSGRANALQTVSDTNKS